jgi:hypothetical protein
LSVFMAPKVGALGEAHLTSQVMAVVLGKRCNDVHGH